MMKYLEKILLLLVITYSVLAAPENGYYTKPKTREEIRNDVYDIVNGLLCPPVGLTFKFEVTTIQTATPMYGCAYMESSNLPNPAPLFHLWLERPELTMVHGHCNDMQNMDHFIFQCLSKSSPVNRPFKNEWKYITLLEHSIKNNTKTTSYRCAVYDVQDYDQDGIRIIRIVIAKARDERLDVEQCESFGNILGEDVLPYVAEGQREWPDGSLYLYMIGKKPFIQWT